MLNLKIRLLYARCTCQVKEYFLKEDLFLMANGFLALFPS